MTKTLSESIKLFKASIEKKGYSEHTLQAYSRDVYKLKKFLGDELQVQDIRLNHLHDFLRYLATQHLSAKTQSRIIVSLKKWGDFLLSQKMIDKNFFQNLSSPKQSSNLAVVASQKTIENALAEDSFSFRQQRTEIAIEFLYGSGLRVSELASLKWNDIEQNTLKIVGKGNKFRRTPITQVLLHKLKRYRNEWQKQSNEQSQNHLFVSKTGKPISVRSLQIDISEILKRGRTDR